MDVFCDTLLPLFITIVSGWFAFNAAALVIETKRYRNENNQHKQGR